MFTAIMTWLGAHISYWPLTAFCALLLAGLNLPISEDALIILSAGIAQQNHSLLYPNYIALYAGIFISDIMSYFIGRLIGKGVLHKKRTPKKLSPENIAWISSRLAQHGFITFAVCRFIPFGVRNALFICAGFTGLAFSKFLLFDSIAAFISSATLYTLLFTIGSTGSVIVRAIGIGLLAVIAVVITVSAIRLKKRL